MTIPLGIILWLIAVILIVYPFFKPGARDIPGDGVLEEEVERLVQELRRSRSGVPEEDMELVCPNCGERCDFGGKCCSECGASLTS